MLAWLEELNILRLNSHCGFFNIKILMNWIEPTMGIYFENLWSLYPPRALGMDVCRMQHREHSVHLQQQIVPTVAKYWRIGVFSSIAAVNLAVAATSPTMTTHVHTVTATALQSIFLQQQIKWDPCCRVMTGKGWFVRINRPRDSGIYGELYLIV